MIMETKMIKVPFKVELAKKITNREVDGKIVTRDGRSARVICWDFSNIQNIVSAISQDDGVEKLSFNFHDGTCCLSSKCDEDLFIEISEYMTFKDGDVIAFDNVKDVFFIIGSKCSMTDENPHYYVKYEKGYLTFGTEDSFCRLKYSRLATESEKQKLIDALKASKDPLAKECLKKLGIEVKQECEFKPFDKVLVRDGNKEKWKADLFSYKTKNDVFSYMCVSDSYIECIPYNEKTAHLLGTTENYE